MSKERSPTGKRKLVLEASLRCHKFLVFLSGMLYSNLCII